MPSAPVFASRNWIKAWDLPSSGNVAARFSACLGGIAGGASRWGAGTRSIPLEIHGNSRN